MDNYKLTVTFSDGEVHTEKFVTEVGMERAIRWWQKCVEDDNAKGANYSILSFDTEVLVPEDELV